MLCKKLIRVTLIASVIPLSLLTTSNANAQMATVIQGDGNLLTMLGTTVGPDCCEVPALKGMKLPNLIPIPGRK